MASRVLAILTIAALLAPGVRWVSSSAGQEGCTCPPQACTCPMHHDHLGHTPSCCAAHGGQCGLASPDGILNSLLSNLVFVPTEHELPGPLKLWAPGQTAASSNALPSHAPPLDQPPRPTL